MSKKRVLVKNKEEKALVSREKSLAFLADALSNPLDLRTPEELSEDPKIALSSSEISLLQLDSTFMEPIKMKFDRSISSVRIPVFKRLLRMFENGNMQAGKLTLQSLGLITTPGSQTNVFLPPGGSSGSSPSSVMDHISSFSDEELDRDIVRGLMDTSPADVMYLNGEVQEASYEVIESRDVALGNGRNRVQAEEGEVSEVTVRETEENG